METTTKQKGKQGIGELSTMTDTEKLYRMNERLEEFHAENNDWERVLQDKWSLAKWTGGSR